MKAHKGYFAGFVILTGLGLWLLWVDYNFVPFGPRTLGETRFMDTEIRVMFVALGSLIAGSACLWRSLRK